MAYGVEAGLRYSDPEMVEARLRRTADGWVAILARLELARLEDVPATPFNTVAAWGDDGRLTPEAPVHSPSVRRKQRLELE